VDCLAASGAIERNLYITLEDFKMKIFGAGRKKK